MSQGTNQHKEHSTKRKDLKRSHECSHHKDLERGPKCSRTDPLPHQYDDVHHFEFVLEQSKEYLSRKLNLNSSLVLDRLVSKGFITQEELEDIKCQPQNNKNQVNTLIECLQMKTQTHYEEFCRILDSAKQEHITEYLRSVIQTSVEDLQSTLRECFSDSYTDVDMLCLHDEGHRVRLDTIYVPIKTVTYKKTAGGEQKRELNHYTEIFTLLDGTPVKKIIVRGEPMAGKTTFLRKVAFDWAMVVQSGPGCTSETDTLKQFTLVLPVILRLVKSGHSLLETISCQLDCFQEKDKGTLRWLLDHYPDKVLLIYDGLDEFDINTCPEICRSMKGTLYRGTYIAITSRGEGISKLNQIQAKVNVEGVLEGFGKKEIKKYVELYFGEYDSELLDVSGLLDMLIPIDIWGPPDEKQKIREQYFEMATNPGRLGILCLLWEQNRKLRDSREELYRDLIEIIIKLSARRNNMVKFGNSKAILDECHDVLIKFGKLALTKEKGRSVMVFTMQQVENVVGGDAMMWGFLFKSHPVSKAMDCNVSFLHKTIQEWMASYYITHTKEGWDELSYNSIQDMEADASLHKFIFHMNPDSMTKIAKKLLPQCFERVDEIPERQILSLLSWLKETRISSSVVDFLTGTSFAKEVTSVILNWNQLHGSGEPIGRLLRLMTRCTTLGMGYCNLTGKDIETITYTINDKPLEVQDLNLCGNPLKENGESLGRFLKLMPHCTLLNLHVCQLAGPVLQDMAQGLGPTELKVETLTMWGNPLDGAGAGLGTFINKLPHCKVLDLDRCYMKEADLINAALNIDNPALQVQQLIIQCGYNMKGAEKGLCRLLDKLPKCVECIMYETGLDQKTLQNLRPTIKFNSVFWGRIITPSVSYRVDSL